MKLTLLWEGGKEETQKVLVTSFNDWFERSEKIEAEVKSDGTKPIAFTFDTPEYGKFTVDYKVIN
jgi:hypothetical protein